MDKTTVLEKSHVLRAQIESLLPRYLLKKKIKKVKRGVSGLNAEALAEDWGYSGGAGHGTWR